MLRVFNNTARFVSQGGGKRAGVFAIYMEPWHADIFDWLLLKRNHGKEELRARDLYYAFWTPDLFMKRVDADAHWTLLCPHKCPGLTEVYGDEFEALYEKYEKEGRGEKTIKARDLWTELIKSQIETGMPYMLYKDAANKKSNQKNIGIIRSSNLCTEIMEHTSKDEAAVCNLASIALPKFVNLETKTFNFDELIKVAGIITRNLNRVIDQNYYPIPETKNSNLRHRPIGLGVQGLADTFAMLKISYDSQEAMDLNEQIFETIYYGAVKMSMELAKESGPYSTFKGSPASLGELQFDMWGVKPKHYDWVTLKNQVMTNGLRNSLLIAPMPTASTSIILGNTESFEAITANIYTRRAISGDFICINKHLVKDLIGLNLWNSDIRNKIMNANGSIQPLTEIPEEIRLLYRTVWEIPQKVFINLAAGRGPFICQSQSLNIYMSNLAFDKISNMHFYGWKKGLKTGLYYLRSRPATDAIKFTVDMEKIGFENKTKDEEKFDEESKHKRSLQDLTNLSENASPKKKLKTVDLANYEDEMCINCGS